ncbi:LOW QUALITY PROTEIN: melanophilin [Perognathus longimembris pacificus]|uniref:LOW QUALITY PROTEIN: melanophilin n=1 Tax=Perognathus longimembris pacificus TaxID=214514 RepID=UPI002019E3A7|nr:LOW QUALITY PROTEIN: melanophilin [Perognathus longimembris pacificus]
MGKKLDLSKLTDEEAAHVWAVVQRDLDLRRREEERLAELKDELRKQASRRELLCGTAQLNESHCAHCLQPHGRLAGGRRQCQDCGLFVCKSCSQAHPEGPGWLCAPCHLARVARMGSLGWYYEHVRARFKRFGSAKVVRSLCGRRRAAGETEPSPGERSGDSEQTDEEGELRTEAQAPALGGRQRRLLSFHDLDCEEDSDQDTQPWGDAPGRPGDPATPRRLQPLSGEPCAEDSAALEAEVPEEAAASSDRPQAEELPDSLEPSGAEALAEPGDAHGTAPGAAAGPGTRATGKGRPPSQYLADVDTSEEDSLQAPRAPSQNSTRRAHAAAAGQISELREQVSLVEHLRTHLESTAAVPPPAQHPAPGARTEADVEEEALRRRLEALTRSISDQGPSTEEEDGKAGRPRSVRTEPRRAQPRRCVQRRVPTDARGSSPQSPRDAVQPGRTAEEALSELESRVAKAASAVQQTESEVSDIESRIAALRAAGLKVKPSGKARRTSSLPIFLPRVAGKIGKSPRAPNADPADEAQVAAGPGLLPRKHGPTMPGQGEGSFGRKSLYHGSLTQRNPHGRKMARHVFAKPVMAQQPGGHDAQEPGRAAVATQRAPPPPRGHGDPDARREDPEGPPARAEDRARRDGVSRERSPVWERAGGREPVPAGGAGKRGTGPAGLAPPAPSPQAATSTAPPPKSALCPPKGPAAPKPPPPKLHHPQSSTTPKAPPPPKLRHPQSSITPGAAVLLKSIPSTARLAGPSRTAAPPLPLPDPRQVAPHPHRGPGWVE